jgi:peptidoglycan/LPS O-acetylase OafA/YrhL
MTALAPPLAPAATATPRTTPRRLDGITAIRGIAVTAVVVYHATQSGWRWLPGGWAGVDVFFVLSGYLVERVLGRATGTHQTRRFYARRWARLGPALLALVVVTLLVAAVAPAHTGSSTSSRKSHVGAQPVSDYLTAAVQTISAARNLAMAGGDATAPAIGHLWSLSIEAQLYLIWPLLFFAARTRQIRVALLLAAAAVSVLAPVHGYHGVADRPAIYFATSTHVVGFALGALCYELRLGERLRGVRREVLLVASAAGLLAIFCWLGEGTLKYQSGSAITSVAACGLLVASCGPDARLATPAARPLLWLGDRSYGLYLWHFPLLAWLAVDPGWTRAVAVVAAVVLADLSFRYVEGPVTEWARRREGY